MRLATAATLLVVLALPTLADPGETVFPLWADALAADLQLDALTEEQRAELAATVAEYGESASGPGLDGTRLDAILAELTWAAPERQSYWAQLWRWLKGQFKEQGLRLDLDWLDMLRTVPLSTFEWISRLSMLAMIVLALVVVVSEVRHGHWRRGRRIRRGGTETAPIRGATATAALDAVVALPRREQPSAVLRIVLAALRGRGLPVAGDGATHREIAAGAAGFGEQPGVLLARLAKLAERARYGGWCPDPHDSDAVRALGQTLVGKGGA